MPCLRQGKARMAEESIDNTIPGGAGPASPGEGPASPVPESDSEHSIDFEQVPIGSAIRRGDKPKREQKLGVRVVPPAVEAGETNSRFCASRASFATSDASLQFYECDTPGAKSAGELEQTVGSEGESIAFQTMTELHPDTPGPSHMTSSPRVAVTTPVDRSHGRKAFGTNRSEEADQRSECQTTQASLMFHETDTSSHASLQFEEYERPSERPSPQRQAPTPSETIASSLHAVEIGDGSSASLQPASAGSSATYPTGQAPRNGVLVSPTRGQDLAPGKGETQPASGSPVANVPIYNLANEGSYPRDSRIRGRPTGGSAGRESRDTGTRRDRPQWQPTLRQAAHGRPDSAYYGGAFGAPPQAQRGGPIERSGHFAMPREIDTRRLEAGKSPARVTQRSTVVTLQGAGGRNVTGMFPAAAPLDKEKRKRYGGQFEGVGSKYMEWQGRSKTPPANRRSPPTSHRPVWKPGGGLKTPTNGEKTAAAVFPPSQGDQHSPRDSTEDVEMRRLREENRRLGEMVGDMQRQMAALGKPHPEAAEAPERPEPPRSRMTIDEAVAAAAAAVAPAAPPPVSTTALEDSPRNAGHTMSPREVPDEDIENSPIPPAPVAPQQQPARQVRQQPPTDPGSLEGVLLDERPLDMMQPYPQQRRGMSNSLGSPPHTPRLHTMRTQSARPTQRRRFSVPSTRQRGQASSEPGSRSNSPAFAPTELALRLRHLEGIERHLLRTLRQEPPRPAQRYGTSWAALDNMDNHTRPPKGIGNLMRTRMDDMAGRRSTPRRRPTLSGLDRGRLLAPPPSRERVALDRFYKPRWH